MKTTRARFQYDAEDPFGTRPDEKPPAGWDSGFWEGVRDRIEQEASGSSGRRPAPMPEPPHGRRRAVHLALAAVVAAAATLAALSGIGRPAPAASSSGPQDASRTLVLVDGSGDPDVAVEWARSGGREAGYVVLTALQPRISYVLIEQAPAVR
ncbi:MAG TPA: hypothetical protein VFP98_10060 [Candidatus Polarisedimenticolia bacterium]|nr:hypothetical protein [Candidatus Polarisedimenticolia bacterium]